MTRFFERELERLKKDFLALSGEVEVNFNNAVQAVLNRDKEMAKAVIKKDAEIDQSEVDLEESCLKLLTLYQPFARDLRYIVAVLKINNDLERVGDLAVNMSKRASSFSHYSVALPEELGQMANKASLMLADALDAFSREDVELAKVVLHSDDEVDALNTQIYKWVKKELKEPDDDVRFLIHVLTVSRQIERMADHVTNIAEDTIYYLEGSIVRHKAPVE